MTAVLFDLDGTLLTLDVDIEAARRELETLFRPLGYRGEFRPILARIGEAAAQVAPESRDRDALIARARGMIDRAELAAAGHARPRAGAAALLAALRARAVATGIVTDNGRACVGPALTAAGLGEPERFDVVVTRDDVERAKPAPDGLLAAARALPDAGARVLFVGDSPRDLEAARGAREQLGDRLCAVAITGGRGAADELAAARPDAVVKALDEILEML